MGEIVEFPSNGKTATGYLAIPEQTGPGVIVIQEWWGLVDHIKDLSDRLASEGFVALAPDLYHGESTTEPDEAGKLLMGLELDEAGRDMAGAHDFLLAHPVVEPKRVGVTGFCAGGNLAYQLAALRPVAAAPFYPYPFLPWPDPAAVHGPVQFHVGELDQGPTVKTAQGLVDELTGAGRQAELFTYPESDHGFFNDTRAEAYKPDQATLAWERMLAFFRTNLT